MSNARAEHGQKISVGHPVDVSSGVVFTAWHDFEFRGHIPILWRRFYTTANTALTPLGHGWNTPFFMSLEEKGEELAFRDEQGSESMLRRPTQEGAVEDCFRQMEIRAHRGGYVIRDWHHHQRLFFQRRPLRGVFLIERIEDLSGNGLIFRYDQSDRLEAIEQGSVSRTFRFSYTARNLIQQIELLVPGYRPEVLVGYEYDGRDNLVRATDPNAQSFRYSYDAEHRLTRETNKLGGSFAFEYDETGRCSRTWGDRGYLERRLSYDLTKRITRVTNTQGATTTYHMAVDGSVARVVDPLGNISVSHSVLGLSQKISATGSLILKEYDARCNLAKLVNGRGDTFAYEYNQFDEVACVIDPAGNRWPKYYDEQGRLSGFEDPLGNRWQLERNQRGEIVRQIDPEGRELLRRHEAGLRWQELSDAVGHYRSEVDPKGRPVLLSDARGVLKMFESDGAGRVIRDRAVDGAEIQFQYDAAGNPTRIRHFNGAVWAYEFSAFSQVLTITKPCGGVVRAQYDLEGNRTCLTNERGEEMRDRYDVLNRLVERKYFDGKIEKYGYDADGHIASIERPDGSVLCWKYDPVGHVVEETILGPPVAGAGAAREEYSAKFEHDAQGRLIKAVNAGGAIEFKFDQAGRLIEEKQKDFTLRYAYDKSGKLIEREFVDGKVGKISFAYNRAGLPVRVADSRGTIQELEYDRTGEIVRRIMRGGIVEEFTTDDRRRLAEQRVSHDGEPVVTRQYRYDQADNLASLQDSLRGQFRWEFDSQSRLTRAEMPGRAEEFIYEKGGDILRRNDELLGYQSGSRLTESGETWFEYDLNGHLRVRRIGDKITRYTYDLKGRLTKVDLPEGESVEFQYDALGRRLSKKSSAGEVHFVWSRRTLAAIVPSEGDPTEMLVSSKTYRPAVQWLGDTPEFFLCNSIGAPLEVIEGKRGIRWSASYASYGKTVERPPASGQNYCLRFPGQFEDRETGLFYNYQRYYDPTQGRFLTQDPIGTHGGLNLYDYPRDPINNFDPQGLSCPNPRLVRSDPQGRWEIYEHANGQLTIRADCTRGFAARPPGDVILRATTHTGADNAVNLPEAHLGEGDRLIVMEGMHRSAAASRGAQMPQDPDNPHLGGVPGRPGWMEYEYSPGFDDDQVGVPLQDLQYPPQYPHQMPP